MKQLTDKYLYPFVRSFVEAELKTQAGHVECFQRLADLLEGGYDERNGKRLAAAFRKMADDTHTDCLRMSAALKLDGLEGLDAEDARDEVARAAEACIEGYVRGLTSRGVVL